MIDAFCNIITNPTCLQDLLRELSTGSKQQLNKSVMILASCVDCCLTTSYQVYKIFMLLAAKLYL